MLLLCRQYELGCDSGRHSWVPVGVFGGAGVAGACRVCDVLWYRAVKQLAVLPQRLDCWPLCCVVGTTYCSRGFPVAGPLADYELCWECAGGACCASRARCCVAHLVRSQEVDGVTKHVAGLTIISCDWWRCQQV